LPASRAHPGGGDVVGTRSPTPHAPGPPLRQRRLSWRPPLACARGGQRGAWGRGPSGGWGTNYCAWRPAGPAGRHPQRCRGPPSRMEGPRTAIREGPPLRRVGTHKSRPSGPRHEDTVTRALAPATLSRRLSPKGRAAAKRRQAPLPPRWGARAAAKRRGPPKGGLIFDM
jgi:hypothetical protein